jgi:uncharacterized 2Fe-2S/4Fe-4S cluster protein (DUF4445 family)
MPVLTARTEVDVEQIPFLPGKSLLHILNHTGMQIRSGCNGTGACGLCLVRIEKGEAGDPVQNESLHLGKDKLDQGIRLACQVMPEHNLQVTLLAPAAKSTWKCLETPPESFVKQVPSVSLSNLPGGVQNACGVAVDLGTTHIKLTLYDLSTGQRMAGCYGTNPQSCNGSDVITRLIAADQAPGEAKAMALGTVEAIGHALWHMAIKEGIVLSRIVRLVLVGNTAMLALLSGRNFQMLLQPGCWMSDIDCLPETVDTWSFLWGIHPEAEIAVMPPLAGFVGSDLLAGLITTSLVDKAVVSLYIDFGTNSEIALWDGRDLYVTSAAGGPAFEGCGLSCGMPAEPGAIYKADIHDGGFDVAVIDGMAALGVCGSGLVDIIAGLLKAGTLNSRGQLASAVSKQGVTLVPGEHKIVLTKHDLDMFQRAKAAVGTGIQVLLAMSGMTCRDLERICISGTFGSFINISNAQKIGLLPLIAPGRIELWGNAALTGCEQALLSPAAVERLLDAKKQAKMVNLSQCPDFDHYFIENLYLQPMNEG